MMNDEKIVKVNERDMAAETVRVVAMFFVICVHVSFAGYVTLATNALTALYFFCNGMFFMLSGKFNLRFKGSTGSDYGKFYLKKVITIGIPFAFYGALLTLYYQWGNGAKIMLKTYARGMFDGSIAPHLWFMFPLVGMLVAAPFLSRLLANLNDTEKRILIVVAFVWEGTRAILVRDILGTDFEYMGWFLDSWPVYFVLGAILDDIIKTKKGKIRLIIAGLICLILTIAQKTLFPEHSFNIFDRSPLYITATLGGYEAISGIGRKVRGGFAAVIRFIAKHSFAVYFLHFPIIDFLTKKLQLSLGTVGNRIAMIGITFVCSVIAAIVIDSIIINPIIGFLKKKIS